MGYVVSFVLVGVVVVWFIICTVIDIRREAKERKGEKQWLNHFRKRNTTR